MRRLLPIIAAVACAAAVLPSCNKDDDDNNYDLSTYYDWRDHNEAWLESMKNRRNPDGTPYYEAFVPIWNPKAYVLMHFFNDRAETAGNLTPLYTSVVDVRYIGYDCDDEPFDSSTLVNDYGQLGVQRFACNQTIQGWSIAMENMHVGDTAEIIVPWGVAYGTSLTANIKPYSSLRFNIRLVDIYSYEAGQ